MRYIKDGIIYEQPIYMTIGDTQLELNDSQLIELGYIPEYEVEEAMARDVENKINMPFNKLQILLDSITVQAPEGSKVGDDVISGLPFKLGQKWVPVLNGNVVTCQLVDDPDAFGLADKPFFFFDGNVNRLFPNAYYMHGNKRYVYVGATPSEAADWSQCSDDMEEF